jgi:tetratricopeptide (TPR) repeat protein
MTTPFEASIVRLRTAEGSIVGAGFLVDEGHVLTCAHVVADASRIPRDAEEKPAGTLYLDFPLISPGETFATRVILWQFQDDIAGLELEEDPPAAARPVRLVTAQDLWLHPFRAFGFPTGYNDGVWASGVLRGRQATGWVQIEDVKEPGYWVQPGFSGTPVWDEQLNGVVGMAVAADVQPGIKAAFMIPARSLIEAWPELALRSLDVNDLVYLEEQLAVLETVQQNAPDPRRFQPRIDELRAAISNWEGRVEQQRQRIAEGLEEQRQQIVESTQRRDEKHLRVIGRRPLDVTDYFKDRQRELMTIGELLAQPTTRLASVIGHGGMGKTALVCKVLRDLERHRWPHTDDEIPLDGIVYLSTRTTGISLERLFLDCAKLLGGAEEKRLNAIWTNPEISTEDKVLHLLKALSGGRYIILLDNIEDLLDDQGQLLDESLRLFFEQGLTTSHGARLLVTSRIALAFRREVMRFDRQVKLLEGLPTEDGVALLRELDPNGEYGLRDAPEEELAQAVSLVHGVPRALEVLAGILANDPLASLAEVLEGFYEQEDVVWALIEEDYKRLDGDARRVIEALAVFRRPVPPLAVDYLLEPFAPGLDVPGIIRRLTRTNIVSVDRATKTVTLHPIDQDYAYSQLPEERNGESEYTRQALERRAADYYVQLRTPPETWKTIDDLDPQLAEFEHRVRAGDYDDACRVLDSIDFDYLHMWGYYAKLVEMRRSILGGLKDPGLRAATLRSLGDIYRATGPFEHAVRLYEEALDITQETGNRLWERATILGNLGRAYSALGQIEKAIERYEEALVIFRKTGNRRQEGIQLSYLGNAYRTLGQVEQAIGYYEQSLSIARKIGDRRGEGDYLTSLGSTYHSQGQFEQAIKLYQTSLVIAREIGNRGGEGFNLVSLGSIYRDLGQFEQSIKFYEEALAIARETGHRRGEGWDLGHLAIAYSALGQIEQAIQYYKEALAIVHEIGDRRGEGFHLGHLGRAYQALVGHLTRM